MLSAHVLILSVYISHFRSCTDWSKLLIFLTYLQLQRKYYIYLFSVVNFTKNIFDETHMQTVWKHKTLSGKFPFSENFLRIHIFTQHFGEICSLGSHCSNGDTASTPKMTHSECQISVTPEPVAENVAHHTRHVGDLTSHVKLDRAGLPNKMMKQGRMQGEARGLGPNDCMIVHN